jgi:precorrin-4/cobalt-precorrin-4 C11-methyltransferase
MADAASQLAPHYGRDCPAAAVYHASWEDQKIVRGTVGDIAGRMVQAGISRTVIVIVGHALERPLSHASKLYDRAFGHGYREAAEDHGRDAHATHGQDGRATGDK